MAPGDVIVYLSLVVSITVLFFIIWDHIKDDRILSMQVQEFYEDIENMIFTNIQVQYYETLQADETKRDDQEISTLTKNKNSDIIQKKYLSRKVFQNFSLYSQYLGLTYNSDMEAYLNGTVYFLKEKGVLKKRNLDTIEEEKILQSYTDITAEQITHITNFLNSL